MHLWPKGLLGFDDTLPEKLEMLEWQVINFVETKWITIWPTDLASCHTLSRKDRNTKPAVMIRFLNKKQQAELLKKQRS